LPNLFNGLMVRIKHRLYACPRSRIADLLVKARRELAVLERMQSSVAFHAGSKRPQQLKSDHADREDVKSRTCSAHYCTRTIQFRADGTTASSIDIISSERCHEAKVADAHPKRNGIGLASLSTGVAEPQIDATVRIARVIVGSEEDVAGLEIAYEVLAYGKPFSFGRGE